MNLLPGSVFPAERAGLLLCILIVTLSFNATSKVLAEEAAETSSEAAPENYQDKWWRSIRKGMWEWEGADWSVVRSALARIESATGKRRYEDKLDTIIDCGPGHWVYEWSQIGNKAY